MLKPNTLLAILMLSIVPAVSNAQTGETSAAPTATKASDRADAPRWRKFTRSTEEFTVETPGEPSVLETSRSVKDSRTFETEPARVYSLYHDGVVYLIASFDNPHSNETLDYFVTAFAQQYLSFAGGGTFKSHVVNNGLGGEEYDLSRGSYKGVARFFLTPNHAYMVAAFGDEENQTPIRRYVDSFNLKSVAAALKTPRGAGSRAKPREKTENPSPHPLPIVRLDPKLVPPEMRPAPDGDSKSKPQDRRAGEGTGTGTGRGIGPGLGGGNTGGGDRSYEGGGGPGGQGGPVDYNRTFRTNEVTRRAFIVFKPEPGYTEDARRNNVTGVVRLRLVLTAQGQPASISIVKGLPDGLTERAILAARAVRFIPAEKDGRRVSQYIIMEYNFNIY